MQLTSMSRSPVHSARNVTRGISALCSGTGGRTAMRRLTRAVSTSIFHRMMEEGGFGVPVERYRFQLKGSLGERKVECTSADIVCGNFCYLQIIYVDIYL
jgi:hypothetical protein